VFALPRELHVRPPQRADTQVCPYGWLKRKTIHSQHPRKHIILLFAIIAILAASPLLRATGKTGGKEDEGEWPAYGRDAGGTRYSPLTQINRQNVARLQVAWTYHTGDMLDPKDDSRGAFEATPILADGTLYLSTPFSRVIALDAETGKERWTYDPRIKREYPYATDPFTSRGVSTWRETHPDGRQYLVICAGGHKGLGTTPGDAVIAFALP
jgi:glucose dehydrogenase